MGSSKSYKETQKFKYISQDRVKKVYQVFETLGKQVYSQNQLHMNQNDYVDMNAPLKKFSMLGDEGHDFEIKGNS